MAEQSKPNTFGGGMVTDIDPAFQPKDTYFHGLNVRVITNGDNSYTLECVKGAVNKKEINYNTVSDTYLSGGNRYRIHGAVILEDYIITFEREITTTTPDWRIQKYQIDSDGSFSTSNTLWSGLGLFDDDAGIIETEATVETSSIHRVYATDGITSLKSINVKTSISSNDVQDFSAFKPQIGAQAIVSSYSDGGGQLKCGSYSYVYRLASKGQTNWSDWSSISSPVNVIKGDLSAMDSLFLSGDTSDSPSTSTVSISIYDIPTEYEIIQVAAIHYVTELSQTVSLIEEGDLSGTTYSFVHSGFETEKSIDGGIANILISNLTWNSCKSLAQKDNKLYAANLTSSLMDLDLSSYRVKSYKWQYSNGAWNSFTHADIHNPHRHYNGSGSNNSYSISDDAADKNVLKFINKNFNSDNTNQNSPKFVLGAETPGYSAGGYGYRITFTHQSYVIDDKWAMSPHGTDQTGMDPWLSGSAVNYYVNHKSRPYRVGSGYNSGSYSGGKPGPSNPSWDNKFRGFKRGECYRFGIVCYDLKGVPGFVHHIGDIKMPDAMDPNNLVLTSNTTDTELNFLSDTNVNYLTNKLNKGWQPVTSRGNDYNVTWAHALIPRIEINFPDSIKDQISGYKIVRLEMGEEDKMIMTQGLLNPIVRYKNATNTPSDIKNKVGVGFMPHLLHKSDADGSNPSWAAGAMEQYGYTLDTPDATIGGKSLSFDSGYDLKIIYPVEMDMGDISYYQDIHNSDLPTTMQSGGRTDLWGDSSGISHTPFSVNDNVSNLVDMWQSWSGLSLAGGGATNDPDSANANIRATGVYVSYKYRPVKIMEDLDKFLSYSDEKLLNGVRREIKFSKTVVNGEEVGTSSSGMSYVFKNSSVQSQAASYDRGWLNYTTYLPNQDGIDHGGQGYLQHCPSTMFISTYPVNLPQPSVVKVDNASSSIIPENHWFGHSNVGLGTNSQTKLWRWNTSKWVCEIIRDTSSGWEQYGGTSDGVIRNHAFISSSVFVKKAVDDFKITEGDTYVDYYTLGKSLQNSTASTMSYGQVFAVESSYNIALRQGVYLGSSDVVNFNVEDNYLYNTAYSKENVLKSYAAKPDNFDSNDYFKSKIAASQTKLTGEPFDAWTVFPASDFIELDLSNGPVYDLVNYRNNIYAVQEQGISLLSINPRALITAEGAAADIQIVSGTGTAIERYDYLTTSYGTNVYNKSIVSPTGFYVFDSERSEIIKCDGQNISPLSFTNSYKSFIERFTKDVTIPPLINRGLGNIEIGLHTGYDPQFRECYFTVNPYSGYRVEFAISDLDGKLISQRIAKLRGLSDYKIIRYIPYKNRCYAVYHEAGTNSGDVIGLMNEGDYQSFSFRYLVNDNATINKVFDTSEILSSTSDDTLFTQHQVYTNLNEPADNYYNSGDIIHSSTSTQERCREGIRRLPLRSLTGNRYRGLWLQHKIIFTQDNGEYTANIVDPAADKKIDIFAINTRYRQSR